MSQHAREYRPELSLVRPPPPAPFSHDLMTAAALLGLLTVVACLAADAPAAVLAGAPLLWLTRRAHLAVAARVLGPLPASRRRGRA